MMILLCQLPLELHPIYSKAYRKIAFNLRSLSARERRGPAPRLCAVNWVCVSRLSVETHRARSPAARGPD